MIFYLFIFNYLIILNLFIIINNFKYYLIHIIFYVLLYPKFFQNKNYLYILIKNNILIQYHLFNLFILHFIIILI